MYYVKKNEGICYISNQSGGALFAIENLLEVPPLKKGYRAVLKVNEGLQQAWYEYEPLKLTEPEPTAADDLEAMAIDHEYRLTLLELGL